ncbi:thiamine diphosphokinase [Tateyamaria sp. Alg231-49]|uniref:thiamine diphosphokinase n=1 Tax=Tateyamaria sp. Alg231-49 TaxID=1922219 RepID=UPI000D558831|nr:thiamine diphosphokinase [Tateyamaria sp. Alg231-49]
MKQMIIQSANPVTLLGGGDALPTDVEAAMALAPTCVAADGGAELAARAGVSLDAVIGDFDSVSPETLALTPSDRQHHIAEQDSTDFDKALRNIDAPAVVGVGFLGARLDHQLAALNVLTSHPACGCVLLGATEVVFLCPPAFRIQTALGDVVSLFPMAPVSGRSSGLQWEIDGLALDPVGQTSTSNAATGPIALTMDRPAMIVMLPRRYLGAVTQALASAPPSARWPARVEQYTAPTPS